MIDLDLNTFANGELREKMKNSFEKVYRNMLDKNTPYKDKRQVILKIVFEQNEERNDITVDIKPSEKLAPETPIRTHIAIAEKLDTGKIYAEEYGGGIQGQISMDEESESNVVDFREVK